MVSLWAFKSKLIEGNATTSSIGDPGLNGISKFKTSNIESLGYFEDTFIISNGSYDSHDGVLRETLRVLDNL